MAIFRDQIGDSTQSAERHKVSEQQIKEESSISLFNSNTLLFTVSAFLGDKKLHVIIQSCQRCQFCAIMNQNQRNIYNKWYPLH